MDYYEELLASYEARRRESDIKHFRWMVNHYRGRQTCATIFFVLFVVLLVWNVAMSVVLTRHGGLIGLVPLLVTPLAIYFIHDTLRYRRDSRATELDYRQKLIDMGAEV